MEIGQSQVGNVLVLHPCGRIDGSTSPEFSARLLDAVGSGTSGVIVDFAEVDYISSAGLHALMKAIRQRKECRLAVAALHPIVQEIFQIARFQHVVQIFGSIEEATASWNETPAPADLTKRAQTEGGQA